MIRYNIGRGDSGVQSPQPHARTQEEIMPTNHEATVIDKANGIKQHP